MGLFDSDTSNADMIRQAEKNRALYGQIALPKYQEYVPQLYNNQTANYHLTQDDPVTKSMQLQELSKLSDLSNEGLSDADVAGFHKAEDVGNQTAKQGTLAALSNAAQRGISGSGLEFAMRDSANQDGAERARKAADDQATARAAQRGQYLQALSNQTGQVRDQDYKTNQANSNVINQFNLANTQAQNATNNANVGQKNSAFMYNQGLQDKNYSNQLGAVDRQAGINTQEGQMTAAQQEADRRRQAALTGAVGGAVGSYFGPTGAAVGYQVGSNV